MTIAEIKAMLTAAKAQLEQDANQAAERAIEADAASPYFIGKHNGLMEGYEAIAEVLRKITA
jgi:flagellar biosynthesis/type III secretory pathway protein FliH